MTQHDAARPTQLALDVPAVSEGLSLREILEVLPPDTLLPAWWYVELLTRDRYRDSESHCAPRSGGPQTSEDIDPQMGESPDAAAH